MGSSVMPSVTLTSIPVICDISSFKKNWAKESVPTYWVEIGYNPNTCMFFLRRRWSWFDREKRQQIEGCTEINSTRSEEAIAELYKTTVLGILSKEYTLVERITCEWSPAADKEIERPNVMPEHNIKKQKIGMILRRKPAKDSW